MSKEKCKSVMGYAIAGSILISVILFFVIVAIVGFPIQLFGELHL
ncbi:MAG: hypothetical protein Q4F05_18505 [bacterium]|nr:hypothetical protein [bacterium]